MFPAIPEPVTRFEAFLEEQGLACQSCKGPDLAFFGNTCLQYGNDFVRIRLVSDRSLWTVGVADAARPDEWYDVGILRDLLVGLGEDVLPLSEQIAFIRTNWQAILDRFNPWQREETHARLSALRMDRVKRLFPALHAKN
jgi:hypothetical protein